jgi:hypothetical protein
MGCDCWPWKAFLSLKGGWSPILDLKEPMLLDGPPSAFGPVGKLRLFPTGFVPTVFRLSGCSFEASSDLSSTAFGVSAIARGPLGNGADLSTGDGAERVLSTLPVDTGGGGSLFSLGYQNRSQRPEIARLIDTHPTFSEGAPLASFSASLSFLRLSESPRRSCASLSWPPLRPLSESL